MGGRVSAPILITGFVLCAASLTARGAIVSGRVIRANGGNPVANADLDFDIAATGTRIATAGDSTDGNGRFAVSVPDDTYNIHFNPPFADRLVARTRFAVHATGNINLGDIALEPGVVVSGRVVRTNGTGVPDADLDADDSFTGERIPTPGDNADATGFFQIVVPQRTLDFTAEPPKTSRLVSVRLLGVNVTSDMNLGSIIVPEGFLVSGRVTGVGGAPISRAEIQLFDSATGARIPAADDESDSSGNFSVVSPPGTIDARVEAPLGSGVSHGESLGLNVSSDRTVNFSLSQTPVSGDIEGTGRLAVPGGRLSYTVGIRVNTSSAQSVRVVIAARDPRGGPQHTILGPVPRTLPGFFGPRTVALTLRIPGAVPPRLRGVPIELDLSVFDGSGQTLEDSDRFQFRIP